MIVVIANDEGGHGYLAPNEHSENSGASLDEAGTGSVAFNFG